MLGPRFIPDSVFYTPSVMLSPRFIPSPCFIPSPQSVVRSPQSVFYTDRLAEIARLEPFTWQKATSPSRVPRASRQVPRVGGLPCLACKRFEAFSKETYEKLTLPEQLGQPGSPVSRGTLPPCKQALRLGSNIALSSYRTQSTAVERWRLFILPQSLANLTRPKKPTTDIFLRNSSGYQQYCVRQL